MNEDIPFIRYPYSTSSKDYYYMVYPVKDFSPNVEIGYIMLSISKEKVENIIEDFMKTSTEYWLVTENETIAATSRKGRETLEIINTVERLSAPNEVEM